MLDNNHQWPELFTMILNGETWRVEMVDGELYYSDDGETPTATTMIVDRCERLIQISNRARRTQVGIAIGDFLFDLLDLPPAGVQPAKCPNRLLDVGANETPDR